MTALTFDIPPDAWQPIPSPEEKRLRDRWEKRLHDMAERRRQEEEEAARLAARPKERLISLKMPTDVLDGLDQIAKDAGSNRSQLIRQLASDFLNYVWVNGITFRGSLLGFKHRPFDRDDDDE